MNNLSEEELLQKNLFGIGNSNEAFKKYFKGNSFLNMLTKQDDGLSAANVTFEPGCRNNWHIHNATKGGGQALLCICGEGWYQEDGMEAVSLQPGDVIVIKPGIKHWHGAKRDSWFAHIAIEIPGENASTQWLEPVTDEEYDKL